MEVVAAAEPTVVCVAFYWIERNNPQVESGDSGEARRWVRLARLNYSSWIPAALAVVLAGDYGDLRGNARLRWKMEEKHNRQSYKCLWILLD